MYFQVRGQWTEPTALWARSRGGAHNEQTIALDDMPTAFTLVYDSVDWWGISRISLDCGFCDVVLLEDPVGLVGTDNPWSDRDVGPEWTNYWFGMKAEPFGWSAVLNRTWEHDPMMCTQAPTTSPDTDGICDLDIYTSRNRYALSLTGEKSVSFMIGDLWTEREPIAARQTYGAVYTHRVRFDPTLFPSEVAIYNDGTRMSETWGIWKVVFTCGCEILLVDNDQGTIAELPALVVGGLTAGTPNPANATLHIHSGECAGTNTPTLPPPDVDFCEVKAFTARTKAAASTYGQKFAAFLVDGDWSDPVPFFESANYADELSAKFAITTIDGRENISPTAVRLLSNSTDSWGFWKVTMECGCFQVLAENPAGAI
jgi:hypothetical protein